jgi:hypothetical protein
MTGVTLITPTGGRPEAFELCELWISRQTYPYEFQWLCSDDCLPRSQFTGFSFQEVINPPWIWKPGQNTQSKNLLLLLEKVKYDKILFIEDDEWYWKGYIESMTQLLDSYDMVGQGMARYYNVKYRNYNIYNNKQHACLARTGIRSNLIPRLVDILKNNLQFIDIELWKESINKLVFIDRVLSIGIKGMPGRPGIGMGHQRISTAIPDPDYRVLRGWIGDDSVYYEKLKIE